MRPRQQAFNENRNFKVHFNGMESKAIKVQLNKIDNVLDINSNTTNTKPEDIYYDEIVYYDGGGVEGWL